MFPKKRRFGFFDWDDDFDRIFEGMEEIMKDLMEKAEKGKIKQQGPIVYGFSMRVTPEGKIIVDEFGNTAKDKEGELSNEREPVTDVINEKEEIVIISELPGVSKEDIQLKLSDRMLNIKVDTPERKYFKNVRLPAQVDPKSAKAHYKNGVLEVRLKKIGEQEMGGFELKIE